MKFKMVMTEMEIFVIITVQIGFQKLFKGRMKVHCFTEAQKSTNFKLNGSNHVKNLASCCIFNVSVFE